MSRSGRRIPRILVVDDDPGLLRLLTIRLRAEKYEVEPVDSAAKALAAVGRVRPDLVVTDLRMAGMDGIELLKELQRRWPSLNVIILTAHGSIPDAVRATQSGAVAFLTKPVAKEQLLEEVRRALATSGSAQSEADWRADFATRSPLMEERLARAHAIASTDVMVVVTGEPGTGKELLGRAIHGASLRREHPLVAIDCANLGTDGAEAELLSAVARAAKGSLLAQDVDELASAGSRELVDALIAGLRRHDVRLIATSVRRPDEPTATEPRLSQDLMDRMTGTEIEMPSLARRREDIPLLVAQCLEELASGDAGTRRAFAPEAMQRLVAVRWPGNARQLRAVVRQAATATTGPLVSAELVEQALGRHAQVPSFDEARDEFTRSYLVQLLQVTEGNVSQAARLARRNRTDFYKLLARYELRPEEFKT